VDAFEGALSQVVALPNPAAGAELTYSFPGSEYTRVRAVTFKLVTSATVATRTVYLDFVDGSGVVIARMSSGFTQTASLTTVYTFGLGLVQYGANAAANIGSPLADLILCRGQKLQTTITNIQAGDAISNARLVVDQYAAPGQGIPQG
jgi:hypothetical protein